MAKNRKRNYKHDSKITTHTAVTKTNHYTTHAHHIFIGRVRCSSTAYCLVAAKIAVHVWVSVQASKHCSQHRSVLMTRERQAGQLCPQASRWLRGVQRSGPSWCKTNGRTWATQASRFAVISGGMLLRGTCVCRHCKSIDGVCMFIYLGTCTYWSESIGMFGEN